MVTILGPLSIALRFRPAYRFRPLGRRICGTNQAGVEAVGEGVHPMATAKEWDDTSPPCRAGVFFPGIPTYLARIMHRLHVGVWRCMCVPTKCECGMSVSFHHVMFSCTSCSDHFQPLTGKLRSVGLPLCTKSLAVCNQRKAGFRARSKDQEILEEGGGAGPSTLPRRDHE